MYSTPRRQHSANNTPLSTSGERVSLPTLCRVLHAHNLCRQRIQHLALRRDEDRARAWLKEMMSFFSTGEILALDETANDRLAYRSTIDWDLRCGTNRPHSRSSFYAVSRTGVSMTGFVSGTRDARRESCHLL